MLVEILLMFQVFKAGEDICYMRETLVADKIITEKMLLKKEEDNNREKFMFLLKKKKKKDPIIPFLFFHSLLSVLISESKLRRFGFRSLYGLGHFGAKWVEVSFWVLISVSPILLVSPILSSSAYR